MKRGASICKSEIKLSFFFFFLSQTFCQGVIRSLLCVDWVREAQPHRSGTTLWLVSHPFSTLMKTAQRKLLVLVVVVAFVCVCVCGRGSCDVPSPKLR